MRRPRRSTVRMSRSKITNGLLHGSQRDDRAVAILARLGHGEDTMGAYIATGGIALALLVVWATLVPSVA
jgi:hypothetical protein